ncbi:unnamed protein product [Lupinus luteus]|uniref:Fe2OG dioxygenase domain-containing protein n=1 Tax=Lupinus luteus TaxID=3873 RepID=A0AAV1WZB0_LUPLU
MSNELVSTWCKLNSSVPSSYVHPEDIRPANSVLNTDEKIPVIDFGGQDRADIIRKIISSAENYGFFQNIMQNMKNGDINLLQDEVVGKYTQQLNKLGLKILELISEGLGLNPEYFNGDLTAKPVVVSHHYPPCPEPGLTLGASIHKDPSTLTILLQQEDIIGLQVFKDGAWIPIQPIPGAFVVNMGFMLQVITNGKLIAALHRVVTNSTISRHTIAYFMNPTEECIVEPAKPVITSTSPQKYRPLTFGQLKWNYMNKRGDFDAELDDPTKSS